MISIEAAQGRLASLAVPLAPETVPLGAALGRWLAEPLSARVTRPAVPVSAMDGYAVASTEAPGPWRVVGTSAAGAPYRGTLAPGDSVRIYTGAALPAACDCVIPQEVVIRSESQLSMASPAPLTSWHHVRRPGSDFEANDRLAERGQLVTPALIALAAAAGHARLVVRQRARVSLLSTGDELVPVGAACDDHQVPSTNAVMIAAMLANLPCDADDLGIVPDRIDAIAAAISAANADLIITSGGASVGDLDMIRPALAALGAHIDFWQIAMRPGKPMLVAMIGQSILLGLPGNPVSAYVTALRFGLPLVRMLGGAAQPWPLETPAILATDLPGGGNRTDHIRAARAGDRVRPIGPNDSSALRGLTAADCLIVRPAGVRAAVAGEQVMTIA